MDTYNQITDTLGIIVGHWTDLEPATGCTVFFLATGHCKRKVGVAEHKLYSAAGVLCRFRAIVNVVISTKTLAAYPSVKDMQ